MDKRFLLAITLSLMILLGYRYLLLSIYGPPPPPERSEPSQVEEIIEKSHTTPLKETNYDETSVVLENPKIRLFLSSEEGAIQKIVMKEYKDSGDFMELIKVGSDTDFIGYMWFSSPKSDPIKYEIVEHSTHKILYKGVLKEGLIIEKEMELGENDYTLKFTVTFKNQTGQTLPLYYQLTAASSLHDPEKRFLEAVAFQNGKRRAFHLNNVLKKSLSVEGRTMWGALKEKYFSLILKPEVDFSGFLVEPTEDQKSLALKVWSTPQNITSGGQSVDRYLFYFGPNRLEELKKLGPWAEGVLHYGMFGGITKFLLWTLTHLHLVVKSYGLSIILLTIIVSVIFLPLTGVSYNSMKRMKLLQPEVEKIRALYKDKPQKLNKELMDLYKRNKVNPLGGCLPMLIQMPIFIAFYNALIHSIELKGAPFLFIKDLSLPDRAIPLPFQIGPLGSAINLLPILMALAMFLQQKLSTPIASGAGSEADAQRMMTTIMPFMFGFIFYGLPSGLVLYWLTNNIVMILTQKLLFRGTA